MHDINFAGLDENLARLRNLLDITRKGMQVCSWMTIFLFVVAVSMVVALFTECILETCGVFPAISGGLCLFAVTINFFVCARAATHYARMHRSHMAQYHACEGVIEYLRAFAARQ
jgi:hypothetical protein